MGSRVFFPKAVKRLALLFKMARKNKAAFAASEFSASPAISNVEVNKYIYTVVFRPKKVEGDRDAGGIGGENRFLFCS